MKILELEDIHTYYGKSHVIQGVSMHIDRGESVSILGRNGVGKTTTLRSIIGLTPPRHGIIRIAGADTTRWPTYRIVRDARVAYVPAERHIFPGLSVEENLTLAKRPPIKECAQEGWTVDRIYEYFPILKDRCRQDGSTLSGGEQQMLAIARGLMGNPDIMLLDEPSQGLAPIIVARVTEIINRLCAQCKLTLLVVEQNFRVAFKSAQRHYLMDVKGQIKCSLTNEQWVADREIVKKHLTIA